MEKPGNTPLPGPSGLKTRCAVSCPVFGQPSELPENVLPTYGQVMKFCAWIRFNKKVTKKEPVFSEIAEEVAVKLEEIWHRASIPIVSHTRILQLLQAYHDKYMKLMKPFKSRKSSETYNYKVQCFKEKSKITLFDIAACKCDLSSGCVCDKFQKVPVDEREFLLDQRGARNMVISGIDVKKTKKLMQIEQRQRYRSVNSFNCAMSCEKEIVGSDEALLDLDPPSSSESNNSSDSEIQFPEVVPTPSTSKEVGKKPQMRIRLTTFAKTCDRHGISDRSAAALASAVLDDIGIVTPEDRSKIIDRSKVRRERRRTRSTLRLQELSEINIHGLYFDGRKDKTIVQVKKGNKLYRQTVVEEHIVLVQEPECNYIGHTSPSSGTSQNIKASIVRFLEENAINFEDLEAVGCDGTVVNTGIRGGVIRLLEEHLTKPLQWFVCMLHGNELPLRHLFHHLDGDTSGPRGFAGPIGKQLDNCEKLPVIDYKPIKGNLPEVPESIVKEFSADQKYLLEMCDSIASGQCSASVSDRNPGKLAHSRWVTTANRILRLYISSENPSLSLTTLTEYIMNVYAPMWFSIKSQPTCKDGAKHLLRTIHLSRYLDKELRDIVDAVIQRNGFFGHHENILLSMLTDDRIHIRELGVRRILKARSSLAPAPSKKVRVFKISALNFEAREYFELINWQDCELTEPPITSRISTDHLQEIIKNPDPDVLSVNFGKYPCHTQCVERCVKLVTEASVAVCGADARDGFIRARVDSRKTMGCFNTKSEYVLKK